MKKKKSSFNLPHIIKGNLIILLTGILLIAGSCNKDDDDPEDPNVIFKATINGASEVPSNNSVATGQATLTFNKDTKIFTVNVTFSGITPTNAHIHKAAVGVSGSVVFGFTNPITSPIDYTSAPLDAAQEADLFAELYYVNIHSADFPGGEIRGQLEKQ